MKRLLPLALLLIALPLSAQVVRWTGESIAVAESGRMQLFDATGSRMLWSAAGPEHVSALIAGEERLALLDGLRNEVRFYALRDGAQTRLLTAESPVDALFFEGDLYLISRDAAALERIGRDGSRRSIPLPDDPAFVRQARGRLYIYTRLKGMILEIDPRQLAILRTASIAPFASDFETDGRNGYLLFPAEAMLRSFTLPELKQQQEVEAGGVPVDMAVARASTPLSAVTLAIADPSAKKLWMMEGLQSVGGAFLRGFLRGLIGLGLSVPQSSEFPTGVDRVLSGEGVTVAYDSATGTLYRRQKDGSKVLAREVAPLAFDLTGRGVAIWQGGALRLAGPLSAPASR